MRRMDNIDAPHLYLHQFIKKGQACIPRKTDPETQTLTRSKIQYTPYTNFSIYTILSQINIPTNFQKLHTYKILNLIDSIRAKL